MFYLYVLLVNTLIEFANTKDSEISLESMIDSKVNLFLNS